MSFMKILHDNIAGQFSSYTYMQEEHLSVSGDRNVHKLLVICLWEACLETVKCG